MKPNAYETCRLERHAQKRPGSMLARLLALAYPKVSRIYDLATSTL